MKRFSAVAIGVLALLGACHAQFLGYISPQTVNQKLFAGQTAAIATPLTSTLPCPTVGNPCGIPNLGQSIHAVTYSISNPCVTGFSMTLRLEATNDGTTFFAISEDATDQNSGSVQGATTAGLTAVGSYAGYRLNLVQFACASGQVPAITANYSGTSTSLATGLGVFYQSSPFRKVIVQNSPTTSALSSVTINTPNGNTAGALYIVCYTAATGVLVSCPALTITATPYIVFGGAGAGGVTVGAFSLPVPTTGGSTVNVMQLFSTPAVSMTFTFGGSGTAGVSWSVYYVSNSSPTSSFVSDPCQNSGATKQSVPINITTPTTTQLVPPVTFKAVYVCGGYLAVGSSGTTAATAQFEAGTGATCGTGTLVLSGLIGTLTATAALAAQPVPLSGGVANFIYTGVGPGLCLVTAGATVNVQGWISFVQQ